ncbi:YitT family protein [Tuberibacillus sp. Marseille-P3662]|uniref:YitT family protein n=1 Tax=Tuberibacillus sp. Marseille-P3662 TaxID=1965358 RepID=UPI000A1CC872|nr:YitT family protein [Tuberibacillus sp. Marseille-P3662]
MRIPIKTKNVVFILLGSLIFGFGLVNFNMQNNLGEGGLTGITLILYNLFAIDPGISNIILNLPLFIIGWRLLGRSMFIYTIIGTTALSISIWIFQYLITFNFPLQEDMTLVALFAGVSIGSGLGIIFRYGGTTGGTDIIARLCNKYFGMQMGKTMFVIDAVVIISSLIYLDIKQAMYTLVAVFVAAQVIDFIQKGAYAANSVMIISNHNEVIAQKIIKELDRSATLLSARGGYTGHNRDVLYCVVSRNEIFRLKNVITSVDPHAFVAVEDIHDVLGEGFTLDENKRPLFDE